MKSNPFILLWSIISGAITAGAALFIMEASNQGLESLWYLIIIPIIGLILTNIILSIIIRKKYPEARWVIIKISLIHLISTIVLITAIAYLMNTLSAIIYR